MTDFRHACSLRAHSGGTVPDLHRIHYSPLSLYELSGTQTLSFTLITIVIAFAKKSRELLFCRAMLWSISDYS